MKILLAFISLLTFSNVLCGQIYISSFFENDIYVGPSNVVTFNEEIREIYVTDLQSDIELLTGKLEEFQEMESLRFLRKSKAKRISKNIDAIQRDINNLNYLKEEWGNFTFLDFSNKNTYCIKDVNSSDKLSTLTQKLTNHNDQYSIGGDTIILDSLISNNYTIIEFLDFQKNVAEPKWVKQRIKNCKSVNPEDCYVWCLVNIEDFQIVDMKGNTINIMRDQIYFDFKFIDKNNRIERQIEMTTKKIGKLYSFFYKSKEISVPISEVAICK